jgi:hypothetical protein
MKRALAAVLFASLALAGCGSVTAGVDFKAPAGWTSTPSILGRMQAWMKKARDNKQDEMVFLVRGSNANIDLRNIPQAGMGQISMAKQSTITICGNQKAQLLSGVGTGHSGEKQRLEMVSATVGQDSFVAMYLRPQSDPADPAAETAIRSLCPAKS